MFSLTSVLRNFVLVQFFAAIYSPRVTAQDKKYWCTKSNVNPGPELPPLPTRFTVNAQLNFATDRTVSEIIQSTDQEKKRESIELWAGKQHVRFISLAQDDAFLTIRYTSKGPSCTTEQLSKVDKNKVYNDKTTAPIRILQLIQNNILVKPEKFITSSNMRIRGMTVPAWEACEYIDELDKAAKVTLYYTDPSWSLAHQSNPTSGRVLMRITVEAHKEGDPTASIDLTADIYNYKTDETNDKDFQYAEDVHCPNFRQNRTFPSLPDSFSYDSEILKEQTPGKQIVLHSTVYYDYTAKLIRLDSQKSIGSLSGLLAPIAETTIMDFKAGVQYTINSVLGSCVMSELDSTLNFLTVINSPQGMLNPKQFILVDGVTTSYSGEYETRGMAADIFSASVVTNTKTNAIFFWYFTPDRTKLIGEEVEKNVLVKVVSRPESLLARQNRTEINFYNFKREKPMPYVFDVSSCYNESLSKTYVITFPGDVNNILEEYEYILRHRTHEELQKTAGVSTQRISMQKITFGDKYFFVQFKILEFPLFGSGVKDMKEKENDLSTAENKIRGAVTGKTLKVGFVVQAKSFLLTAEPDGFKEFKEDKKELTFNERSVAGLSIGMTVLGFLLGGVVVNLIFTRKYGVSLLQKTLPGSDARTFDNPLNESSM